MSITGHESVLAALANRATHFSCRGKLRGVDDNLVTWALDKTGTVNTSLILITMKITSDVHYSNNKKELG
jgi:hypothetical protein